MDCLNSIIEAKAYGKIMISLAEIMDKKGITRNKLRTLTGVKYDVIDRYYKSKNIERVDLDFLAKVCFVLNCRVEDILHYEKAS